MMRLTTNQIPPWLDWIAVVVAVLILYFPGPALADRNATNQYLLVCPADDETWKLPEKGLHWKALHQVLDKKAARLIHIVDRPGSDGDFFLDIEGLRLAVSSGKCRIKTATTTAIQSSQGGIWFVVSLIINCLSKGIQVFNQVLQFIRREILFPVHERWTVVV